MLGDEIQKCTMPGRLDIDPPRIPGLKNTYKVNISDWHIIFVIYRGVAGAARGLTSAVWVHHYFRTCRNSGAGSFSMKLRFFTVRVRWGKKRKTLHSVKLLSYVVLLHNHWCIFYGKRPQGGQNSDPFFFLVMPNSHVTHSSPLITWVSKGSEACGALEDSQPHLFNLLHVQNITTYNINIIKNNNLLVF